jgi:cysteine desulfuration protein SufE
MSLAALQSDFELLDDWEDRYRYIIELGRTLAPFPEADRSEETKVRGCASQVWLTSDVRDGSDVAGPVLHFEGDSDAHIVRGLIAILFALYQDKTATEILALEPQTVFQSLGLKEHLTPQRSNGLASMVERIRSDARAAAAS